MDPVEPSTTRPPTRHHAHRARWIVGTSAVAAGIALTGVVAAQGSGADTPTSTTPADPAATPDGRSVDPGYGYGSDDGESSVSPYGQDRGPVTDRGDDDGGYGYDDGSSSDGGALVPSSPGPSADSSSRGS